MTNWIVAIVGLFFVVGYCTIQFKRTRDRWYALALALPIGLAAVSILLLLSPGFRFFGISWQTWLSAYFVLTGLLVLYTGFRALWPYPIVKASQLYAKAVEFYKQGDMRQASRVLRQLIAVSPRRADARYWLGRVLNEQGKYREAVRHLKFAQELNPELVGTLLELGFAFKMLKNYQGAANAFEQALALDPDNAYAAEQLEICQRKLQDISTVS